MEIEGNPFLRRVFQLNKCQVLRNSKGRKKSISFFSGEGKSWGRKGVYMGQTRPQSKKIVSTFPPSFKTGLLFLLKAWGFFVGGFLGLWVFSQVECI